MTIRVLLADDQELVRTGFRYVLDAQPDMVVVGEVKDGQAAVEAVAQGGIDLVLMDIRMPRMDGVEATRQIRDSGAPTRVLVLTTFDLDEYAFGGLQAGASGLLLKDARPAELVDAIRAVHRRLAVIAPPVTARLSEPGFPALPRTRHEGHDCLCI